jgi:chromosome segregation ATPase
MLEDADMERIIQAMTNVVLPIKQQLNTLEGRFDTLEGRFDTLEGRFDTLEGRFDTLEGRMDRLEAGQQGLLARMDQLEEGQRELKDAVKHLETGYNAIGKRLDRQSERLDKIESRLDEIDAKILRLAQTVDDHRTEYVGYGHALQRQIDTLTAQVTGLGNQMVQYQLVQAQMEVLRARIAELERRVPPSA